MIQHYRKLVMFREPLARTASGYHVPSSDEVIAGIKAYFDPVHKSIDAAPAAADKDGDLKRIGDDVISIFRGTFNRDYLKVSISSMSFQELLLRSIKNYIEVFEWQELDRYEAELLDRDCDFTVPVEISEALSKVSTTNDIRNILPAAKRNSRLDYYLSAWAGIHVCLENAITGPACECPFVYFFVKYCLEHGWGVPKLPLALYDRMNLQLSREFIRCANPTCELNRLDQSTGQVKFKLCSRCRTVIYCSRECQTAHYTEHKMLCREHSTGREGS